MITKISTHLESYLKSIGEEPVRESYLGPHEDGQDCNDTVLTPDQIEHASNILIKAMKTEKNSRLSILYVLLGVCVLWFLLCAWVIIYFVLDGKGTMLIGSTFGIDLGGLALLFPFMHCVHQSKTKIDVFLAIFPNLGHEQRAEMSRTFFQHIKESKCDIGFMPSKSN